MYKLKLKKITPVKLKKVGPCPAVINMKLNHVDRTKDIKTAEFGEVLVKLSSEYASGHLAIPKFTHVTNS